MPVYKYAARSLNGANKMGEIEANDPEEAKAKLRGMKLVPLRVAINKTKNSIEAKKEFSLEFFQGKPVNTKDLQIFTRQFSTLINSGIPVVEALGVLTQSSSTPALKDVLDKAKKAIEGGKGLGDAFAQHPRVFDNFYCNMIRAGESSGALDVILGRMSLYLEKTEKLRGQIKSAMMYPTMIILVASIVVTLILIFIIPKFQDMYKSTGGQLPALTQMVVNISEFMQHSWYLLFGALIGGFIGLRGYYGTPEGKKAFDEMFMKMPLFGDLFTKTGVARFSRTMSTLLSSGVPIIEAIDVAAKTVGNAVIEKSLIKCRESVAVGKGFSGPIAQMGILPKMVAQMVMIGEQTGSLDAMLGKIADFYEDEVDNAVKGMMSLMEPILLVFIGGIIAVLVLAMYLPVFGMADAATKGM